jgi:hypothetical protein
MFRITHLFGKVYPKEEDMEPLVVFLLLSSEPYNSVYRSSVHACIFMAVVIPACLPCLPKSIAH